MRLLSVVLLPLALVACSSGVGKGDGIDSGNASGDLQTDVEEDEDDAAPVLQWATVTSTGSTCFIEGAYDDPQGAADVRRGTVMAVDSSSGEVLWTDDLFVCVDYRCVGSFGNHPSYSDAPCSAVQQFELQGFVFDRSGNESNTQTLEH